MTAHWEFTYGAERVKAVDREGSQRPIDFIAQNVKTTDFGDPVFKPYVMREINGVPVAIIGQAFPYTPDRQSALLHAGLDFRHPGASLQKLVDEVRAKGAQAGRAAVAQRHGCRSEARVARDAASTPSSAGIRTTACRRRSRSQRSGRRWSPTPAPTASSSACSISTSRTARSADYRYRLLPVFANLLARGRGDGALDRKVRGAVRGEACRRSSL